MLSRALIRCPQRGQCDGGDTIDSARGTRQMTTLRKLPTQAPRSAAYIDATAVRVAAAYCVGASSRQEFCTKPAAPAAATRGNAFGSYVIVAVEQVPPHA